MNEWLNEHPLILSSLESKGLEFNDVVVAFDFDRKAWDLSSDNLALLRILRELYVASTRAIRRVVILIRGKAMKELFRLIQESCNVEESDAKLALQEFDRTTTPEEWLDAGMRYFEVRTWSSFQVSCPSPVVIDWCNTTSLVFFAGRRIQNGFKLLQASS